MKTLVMIAVLIGLTIGCTKQPEPESVEDQAPAETEQEQPPAEPETTEDTSSIKSDVESAVEGVTGIRALRSGEKAKEKLQGIDAKRKKQMEDLGIE